MVDKKYKDFDAALDEAENKAIEFKISGTDYELPGQLPARVVLTQMRFMDESGGLPQNSLPEWLESLVGKDNLDDMLDKGATWNQLDELLQWLLTEYGIAGDGEEEVEVDVEGEEDPKE
jgi:hypothetical protein